MDDRKKSTLGVCKGTPKVQDKRALTSDMVPEHLLVKVNSWRVGGERIPITNDEARQIIRHNVTVAYNGCWLWRQKIHAVGYGRVHARIAKAAGITDMYAHRIVLALWTGVELTSKLHACHNCPGGDNPMCCNPDHLWAGDKSSNARDASKKGMLKQSAEHIRWKSERYKGRPIYEDQKEKIRQTLLGRKLPEAHKASISAGLKGKKKSPEHVAKVRASYLAYLDRKKRENLNVKTA